MAFSGLRAGWDLAKSVRRMVSGDRGLLIYPVVSGIIGVILFSASMVGSFLIPAGTPIGYRVIIGLILAYLVTSFVSTYFLVAMLIAFKSYESGEKIGMAEALSMTRPYALRVLEWALFYTTLIMLLRLVESRFRGISQIIIAGIGSLGITVATFFAVPAILEKKVGPIDAVRESFTVIKRTIGPIFAGVGYIDLYTLVFALSGFLLAIGGAALISTILFKLIVVGAGVSLIVVGLVLNFTYFNIFKLILYDYFNGNALPEGIDEKTVQAAIKRRRGLIR